MRRGFTLIEILVVVAIIAVLAVIGAAVFTGLIPRGTDARVRSDVDAVVKAFEVKFGISNAGFYPDSVAVTDFAAQVKPTHPDGSTYTETKTGAAGSVTKVCVTGKVKAGTGNFDLATCANDASNDKDYYCKCTAQGL